MSAEDADDDNTLLEQKTQRLVYVDRFEYAFSDKGGHGVVQGKRARFTRCEDEKIHIPGAIQSHGMLVALEVIAATQPRYSCRVVSENSEVICSYTPRRLFGLPDFAEIFPSSEQARFHSNASSVRSQFARTLQSLEPTVFPINVRGPLDTLRPAWCAMHFIGNPHNLLVCEMELQEETGEIQVLNDPPPIPYSSLDSDPRFAVSSHVNESASIYSKAGAAGMFQGQGRTMEVLNVMSQVQHQLSAQQSLQALLDIVVGLVKELTGHHRCMVYKFDEDDHGLVVAEMFDPRASSDIFMGVHFPASDIPRQARELYKINRVRVIFDREQQPSRLICKTAADLESPLDLTHSYLRAASPIHLKYLGNMGARSSMTVALNYRNELWGLICCQSYGPTGVQVPFPVRELCYWIGLCASNCLDKLLNLEKIQARQVVTTMQLNFSPHVWLSASSEELLRLFRADFGFLVVQGEARTIGKLSSYIEAVTLLRYVYFRNFNATFASRNITKDFSDLVLEDGFENIAGLLFIPLSQLAGDFVVFFRKNQVREIHWAGNPNLSKKGRAGELEPRNSFKRYTETVRGTCQPWGEEQFEAAAMTRLVYGNFIRVWREKEAALQESRMKRLLLLNISHELRTPLNAVVNYLELALEHDLDGATKDILASSHRASQSATYVLDDLLHLTDASRHPPPPLLSLPFDLPKHIHRTLKVHQKRVRQKGLTFDVIEDINFPRYVLGDSERLESAVASLVMNSIQYTDEGGIVVHLGTVTASEQRCTIQISVQDSGVGMSEQELDNLFKEFEMVPDEDANVTPEEPQAQASDQAPSRRFRLGLGLALLTRFVKHCGGSIRVKSQPGKGSTFTIEIPLQLTSGGSTSSLSTPGRSSLTSQEGTTSTTNGSRRPSSHLVRYTSSPAVLQNDSRAKQGLCPVIHPPQIPLKNDLSGNTQCAITELSICEAPTKVSLVVLVVDDNSVNCAILSRRLKRMTHSVKIARDGQQCLEIYQKCRDSIDLVLMDLNMPMINGVQATRMIRTLEGRDILTSNLSSQPARSVQEECKSPGIEAPRVPTSTISKKISWSDMPNTSTFGETRYVPPSPSPSKSHPATKAVDPLLPMQKVHKMFNAGQRCQDVPSPQQSVANTTTPGSFSLDPIARSSTGSYFASTLPTTESSPQDGQISHMDYYPPGALTATSSRSSYFASRAEKRVPIFAVSASLNLHSQESLEDAGFDGWLSKPLDFARLMVVLKGAISIDARSEGSCRPNDFKRGGWFE